MPEIIKGQGYVLKSPPESHSIQVYSVITQDYLRPHKLVQNFTMET